MLLGGISGLAQYSGDPKTEWHLNAHSTRESLLEAVANLPYKGGNTMTGIYISQSTQCIFHFRWLIRHTLITGLALNYILQNNFKENVGMRPNSRKIGVLVTDGKSQDDVHVRAENLRSKNIELYAIGTQGFVPVNCSYLKMYFNSKC